LILTRSFIQSKRRKNVVNAYYELNTTQEDSLLLTTGQISYDFYQAADKTTPKD